MKKLTFILVATLLIGLMPATACQTDGSETHTPIPVKDMGHLLAEEPAPDDILPAYFVDRKAEIDKDDQNPTDAEYALIERAVFKDLQVDPIPF